MSVSHDESKYPLYFYPREHISISSLNSFENCPLSFFLYYYLGIESPEKARVFLGSKFQEALNAKYSGGQPEIILEGMEDEDRQLAQVLMKQANNFDEIISIDSQYMTDLGFGIPFKFSPDLVTKEYIVENKYTSGYYNKKMVSEQKQGTLYYLGVKNELGLDLPVLYQLFNKNKANVELVVLLKKMKDVDDLMIWIDTKLTQIEKCYNTGIWDTGNHSRFDCDLGKACPIKHKN